MLSCHIQGKGNPLVLLHAFPFSSEMWKAQTAELQDRYTVIVPDLPGFGKSKPIPKPSIAEMAKQVAAILDHLHVTEPAILGGLSMGGYVAFEFIRQFPERVRGLLLFATRAGVDSDQARENRFRSIEAVEKFGLEAYVKKIIKAQLGKTSQQRNPRLAEECIQMMLKNNPQGVTGALRAMAERQDSTDLLASISFPTLVVAGEEDSLIDLEEAKTMHRGISGAEFHLISESGHLLNLEQPAAFQKILNKFLQTQLEKKESL